MILHIVRDSLYSDSGIEQFEKICPGRNIGAIWGQPRELQYVKQEIEFINDENFKNLVNRPQIKGVVLHSLTFDVTRRLKDIEHSKKVCWVPWGTDYYTSMLGKIHAGRMLLSETQKLSVRFPGQKIQRTYLEQLKTFLGKSSGYLDWRFRRDLNRIDLVLFMLDYEWDLMRDCNPWFNPALMPWGYPHGELSENNILDKLGSEGVMLGNSSSLSNNHIDGLVFLYRYVEIGSRNIICPLSYGDPRYGDYIEDFGVKLYGSKFHALRSVMPRDQYHQTANSCDHAFFFHLRQEALGNILVRIFRGTKVYLSNRNPILHWLRSKHVFVECIEDIEHKAISDGARLELLPLNPEQVQANRIGILKLWSTDEIDRHTRNVVDEIFN